MHSQGELPTGARKMTWNAMRLDRIGRRSRIVELRMSLSENRFPLFRDMRAAREYPARVKEHAMAQSFPAQSSPQASVIKAYWQPGCTSCLRMKEFLTRHGVPFVSVNVLEDKAGFAELAALGIRTVPIVR